MTIIHGYDDYGPSTSEMLVREFGDGVGAVPFLSEEEMDEINARLEAEECDSSTRTTTSGSARHCPKKE